MPKRDHNTTRKCHVCQAQYVTKSTRQKYCSKACSKKGLRNAVDRQTARREFAKSLGLRRSAVGYEPKLDISKEAWRIVSEPGLTMREKYEKLPEQDRRIIVQTLEELKQKTESLIASIPLT